MRTTRTRILASGVIVVAAGCEAPRIFPGMGRSQPAPEATLAPRTPAAPSTPAQGGAEPPAVVRAPLAELPIEASVARPAKPQASAELTTKGLALFATNCQTCHGAKGAGDGPAAFVLDPRPRNFTRGIFELHSNESGALPLDEDLFDTITRGIPGSAMPAFERLAGEDRWALVEAVKSVAVFKDEDEGTEIHFFADRPPTPPIDLGAPVAASPEVVAQGKAVFQKLECWKCHGTEGKGDGPSASDLRTAWGEVTRPRDFEAATFNGAFSVRDLVLRVRTGLGGTPMPAVASAQASDADMWAVAHYVASLRKGAPAPQPPKDGTLVSSRCADAIPANLLQPKFWTDVPAYELALSGDGPKTASVQVLEDAANLAVLVSWDDPIEKTQPAEPADFLKGVTVTLAADNVRNEWEWRSEWQRDAAKRPSGAFEEGVLGATKLDGVGLWSDGRWRVLFVRPLAGGGDRIALRGRSLQLTIGIADRRSTETKVAKSTKLTLTVR
jgi:cytochrome c oxidase cbb3-type subunit 2